MKRVGLRASRRWPDTVTFKRAVNTTDSVGGVTVISTATSPANIPCLYQPYTGSPKVMAGTVISDSNYVLKVPAYYANALVDVDAKCVAVVAARPNGEVSRTFNIDWVGRREGIEIEIYCSLQS